MMISAGHRKELDGAAQCRLQVGDLGSVGYLAGLTVHHGDWTADSRQHPVDDAGVRHLKDQGVELPRPTRRGMADGQFRDPGQVSGRGAPTARGESEAGHRFGPGSVCPVRAGRRYRLALVRGEDRVHQDQSFDQVGVRRSADAGASATHAVCNQRDTTGRDLSDHRRNLIGPGCHGVRAPVPAVTVAAEIEGDDVVPGPHGFGGVEPPA